MSNIYDVAKLAGVSKSTVSRVISNTGYVKPDTKQAVEDAIKKLNYTPSYFAQGIRTRKTKTIALLVPDYTNVFYNEMFAGVEEIAVNHNYMVMICNTNNSFEREKTYVNELLKRNVDGIIYNTYMKNKKSIDFFVRLSEELPVVFMDHVFSEYEDISYVVTDGFKGSYEAVKYLQSTGRKRIGYIKTPPQISVVEHRYEGYYQGLIDCGLTFDPRLTYQYTESLFDLTKTSLGKEGVEYFMSLDQMPDAIMCTIDYLAIGAVKSLMSAGYNVPHDIAVMGYDNISLCEYIEPALTTISQPTKKLGEEATRILINKIENGVSSNDKIMFESQLIIRKST